MLISLTVGKVDAGLAILLTEDKRLIEFPSVLLPTGVASGSIVDIQVSRNAKAEAASRDAFQQLQDEIYNSYGIHSPKKPVLRVRNATQTSIVLEWDPIELAAADLRSLTLYRNNSKAGSIPNPTSHTSTKISGLSLDTEYSFHLVLRTSAGTYPSEKVTIKTHKMTDLSGITVCPGIMPAEARERLEMVLERMGAKPLQDSVRIDTTHFVCTEARGPSWERAQDMNVPIVRPEWVEACENEGRIVGVRQFYLGADISKMRQGLQQRPPPANHQPTQSITSTPSPTPSRPSEALPVPPSEKAGGTADLETRAGKPEEASAAAAPSEKQEEQGHEEEPKEEEVTSVKPEEHSGEKEDGEKDAEPAAAADSHPQDEAAAEVTPEGEKEKSKEDEKDGDEGFDTVQL